AFSPDGSLLLVGSNDRLAVIYDIAAKKVKTPIKGHTESVRGVAFAPDGKLCAGAEVEGGEITGRIA
ncbi:MAG TPA: hypothetical protein VHR66_19800, partial [Gemmataceae bacterium]|nr:hypothetical protein [Gemmataceae bacterium]